MVKTFKIAVDAGHGGYKSLNPKVYATAGKRTPDGEPEWIFNDKILRAFIAEVSKYENVEVRRFDDPTGKTDVPLKTRTNNANAWGVDIYISFHNNALSSKWGNWTGTETFIYTHASKNSERLAKCVHPKLVDAIGLRDRGIKRGNLHIVREMRCPVILLEGMFMDSVIDIKKLRDDNVLRNAGIAVANGVVEYASLKKSTKKEGELTVSQAKELQSQIDELKKQLTNKSDKPDMSNVPSTWAKEVWDIKVKESYFDGTAPKGNITREQGAILIDRLVKNIDKWKVEPLKDKIAQLEKEIDELKGE